MSNMYETDVHIIKASSPEDCLSVGEEIVYQCPAEQSGWKFGKFYFAAAMAFAALTVINRGKAGMIIGLILLAFAVCAVIFGVKNDKSECTFIVTNMRVICFTKNSGQLLEPFHIRNVYMRRRKDGMAELTFDCFLYTRYDVAPPFINGPVKMEFADALRVSEAVDRLRGTGK